MQRTPFMSIHFVAALLVVIFGGCSSDEFVGRSNDLQPRAVKLTDQKNAGTDGADGVDGDDSSMDDDDEGFGKDGGDFDDDDNDDDEDFDDDIEIDEDEWAKENGECRFFADEDYAELVEGGPGIEIAPAKMNGRWEGDDYVFSFDAWQGALGATAQLYDGHGPVVQIGGGVDLPDYPAAVAHLMPKDKDHWQLTPIMIGGAAKYGVKHSYEGVIENAKSESCELQLTETETPFLDRTGGGCFALTTKIRMADGSNKFVALLNVGDQVLNPVTGKAARITEIVSGPEADQQMIQVGFGKDVVRVTQMHPMPTARGLLQARHLTKADRILGVDGQYHAVTVLKRLPVDKTQVVRNLVINPESQDPNDHMLLADGVVTGDLYLQRSLEEQNKGLKRLDRVLLSQSIAL